MEYRQAIARQLTAHLQDMPLQDVIAAVEEPQNSEMGHFAYPCFKLAKSLKKAPQLIAADIAEKIQAALPSWIEKVESAGAYVNFFLDRPSFAEKTLGTVRSAADTYGSGTLGAGKVVVIDYSSPNVAKHFHIGHLGTTVIGRALYNLFNFLGYETIGINYLGDWGTSFGKLLTAYLKWGDKKIVEETGIDGLNDLYVRFHNEADTDPALEEEARSWVVKMENGDEEALNLWRWVCAISMREYNKIYERMGISFESYRGESYYNGKMDASVDELRQKNLLTESEGAQLVDLEEYKMPPCLILRKDGGTLYATRDITAAKDRFATYRFDKSLYVVATEQNLYFSQLFKVLDLMGYPWAKNMVHVNYGMLVFESGRMSTRRGEVIKMKDLLDESVAKTLSIIEEKNPDLEDKAEVAEQVGIGAVIFNQMYNNRIKDVLFNWEKLLNFEGETGPYVQYTHARACSVLKKAASLPINNDADALTDDDAFEVLRLLNSFPDRVCEAAEKYEPYLVSRFLVALAQAFNKFYNSNIILSGDEFQSGRLALTDAVRICLQNGLRLLGISAPQKM